MIRTVYARVAGWNAKRYEQDYDAKLAIALLEEELQEWVEATTPVDKLDALCDLAYVAYGVVWKAKTLEEDINKDYHIALDMISLYEQLQYSDIVLHTAGLIKCLHSAHPGRLANLIAVLALAQMLSMGLSYEQAVEAMHIVCDANDSKSVTKTASHIKANKDKGADFVGPEARLEELLKCVKY